MTWSTHQGPPSDAAGQWGHNIKVVGVPRRESGSKRKSFMADTFGFANDGELQGVISYLRSHGGFKLEQVRPKLPCFSVSVVKQPVSFCLFMVACIIFNTVDCVPMLLLSRPSTSQSKTIEVNAIFCLLRLKVMATASSRRLRRASKSVIVVLEVLWMGNAHSHTSRIGTSGDKSSPGWWRTASGFISTWGWH